MTTETLLSDGQIRVLFKSVSQEDYTKEGWVGRQRIAIGRAIEQAVLQTPEVQRLREDAARYRWLRNESLARAFGNGVLAPVVFNCDDEFQHSDVDHLQLSELDSEIDAAMKEQP